MFRSKATSPPGSYRRIVLLYLCISIARLNSAAGEEDLLLTVRMKGSADGVGLTSRKVAIEQAQQRIMEEVLQSMTHATDMTLFNPILRQTSRYIPRYDLLRTDIAGETTEVEIDAYVLEKPLRRDIAAIMLPRLPRKPSVQLLIADYVGPGAASGGPTFDIAETVLRKALEEFEFTVRGIQDILDHYEVAQLLEIIQGEMDATASFARANGEDVVIVGAVTTVHEALATDSNMLTNRARITLRILSGTDGKASDTLAAEAAVQSVDPVEGGTQAAQDACGKLTTDCIVGVVIAMLGLEDESRVIFRVEGPNSPETMTELEGMLRAIPGVSEIESLFYSPTLARLAVDYGGTMAYLSDLLAGRPVNGRKIEIGRCVQREITIRFK
ncbi:MAG: hypothetical protein BWY09_01833 [Candidatus Hydrogenedentes bacterium ADurb.Bin179]|nr:MAG: hypothetical protein BWY09_01833 [Candidatus Hydrogenedentes bacterium ADurb.Bin179]